MATHLGTGNGTGFNVASMKPETDDQTDSLWGRNLADNLMWLATREQQVINHTSQGDHESVIKINTGTLSFKRYYGHDEIYGTINVNIPEDDGVNWGTFYIDGTVIAVFSQLTSPQTKTFTWDLLAKDVAPKISNGEIINVTFDVRSGELTSERSDIQGFQAWSHNSAQFPL